MATGTVDAGVLHSSLSDLVLRIHGTSHNGQVLRLRSSKCTIGSGPNCTLRLHGHGISHLHCLILRGPNGTVIRRWSPDTRLNGRSFSEAPLSPGDRLSIGSLEFEIVETGEFAAQSPDADAPYPYQYEQCPSSPQPGSDLQLESQRLNALRRQIRQDEESLHKRAKQIEDAAAELAAEQNKFHNERRQDEESLHKRTKQIEDAAAELAAEQNKFHNERRQWEESHNALFSEESLRRAAAEEEQLARLKTQSDELDSQRQSFALHQRQWQAEQETLATKSPG